MPHSRFLNVFLVTSFSLLVITSLPSVAKTKIEVGSIEVNTTNLYAQTMPDTNGQRHKIESHRGKTLLVNFWATWCTSCIKEMPELSELQNELSPRSIQIIGIGLDNQDKIIEFAKKYDVTYPIYIADVNGQTLLSELGNQAGVLPFTVLINHKGVIKKTYLGRLNMNEIRKDILALDKKRF